ncbi:MAG: hypothetical protein ACFFG0_15480 [Candidatus Thorarchaeota archaeon]
MFEKFLELSERDRNEEGQIAKELGIGCEFKKDRFNFYNVLIYNTIEETLIDEQMYPITKELVSLWLCP